MSKPSDDNFCEALGIRKALADAAAGRYEPPPRKHPDFFDGLRLPKIRQEEIAQERIMSIRYLRSLIAYRRALSERAPALLQPITEKDRLDPALYGQACALVDLSRDAWEQPTPQVCFGPSPDWSRDRFRRGSYIAFMKAYIKAFDLIGPSLKKPLAGMLPPAAEESKKPSEQAA